MTYTELLKNFSFWVGMSEEDVSNDASLKATVTAGFNRKLERYLGMLGATSNISQVDDTNYTNHPFSLFDIEEDQHDYEFLEDEDGNTITDITAVLIKVGNSFIKLDKMTLDNPNAELVMSPNATKGVPTKYLERNNTVFFDPIPNYSLVEGGKLFYKRAPSYFATTDTLKQPGLPVPFHELISMSFAYDWNIVHKQNGRVQISDLKMRLDNLERELITYQQLRNPFRGKIIPRRDNTR